MGRTYYIVYYTVLYYIRLSNKAKKSAWNQRIMYVCVGLYSIITCSCQTNISDGATLLCSLLTLILMFDSIRGWGLALVLHFMRSCVIGRVRVKPKT